MSCFQRLNSSLILGISLCAYLLPTQLSFAQSLSVPQPSTVPLQLSLLRPPGQLNNSAVTANNASCDRSAVVTANTVCQQTLTTPSLWWAKEQFGDKLLDNWLAYPANSTTAARVDLVVNRQIWSLLDYLQRYEFVNQFGTVARDYGYNVRVFNYQKELLATYTCNFNSNQCSLQLDTRGLTNVRGAK